LAIAGRDAIPIGARPARRREKGQEAGSVTIPNLISILRLFLVPLIIWLISSDKTRWAFFAFVLAGISDGIDGFLARQFNMGSALGAYLTRLPTRHCSSRSTSLSPSSTRFRTGCRFSW
jgi:cardiolipin synthase